MASWHTKKWTKGRLRNMNDYHSGAADAEAIRLRKLRGEEKPSEVLIASSARALAQLRANAARIASIVSGRIRRASRGT